MISRPIWDYIEELRTLRDENRVKIIWVLRQITLELLKSTVQGVIKVWVQKKKTKY